MYSISQLIGNKAIYGNRIDVDVTIVRETLRAYLISFDPFDYGSGFDRQKWLPKSWILEYKFLPSGEARITISEANWTKKFD